MSDSPITKFVVLFHKMPAESERNDHWDLMLQDDERLLTWELSEYPAAGSTLDATRLPDHRLKYLEYQGPISGNRGEVIQVLKGRLEWTTRDDGLMAARLHDCETIRHVEIRRIDNSRFTVIFS